MSTPEKPVPTDSTEPPLSPGGPRRIGRPRLLVGLIVLVVAVTAGVLIALL